MTNSPTFHSVQMWTVYRFIYLFCTVGIFKVGSYCCLLDRFSSYFVAAWQSFDNPFIIKFASKHLISFFSPPYFVLDLTIVLHFTKTPLRIMTCNGHIQVAGTSCCGCNSVGISNSDCCLNLENGLLSAVLPPPPGARRIQWASKLLLHTTCVGHDLRCFGLSSLHTWSWWWWMKREDLESWTMSLSANNITNEPWLNTMPHSVVVQDHTEVPNPS